MSSVQARVLAVRESARYQPWSGRAPRRQSEVQERPAAGGGAYFDISRIPVTPAERPVPLVSPQGPALALQRCGDSDCAPGQCAHDDPTLRRQAAGLAPVRHAGERELSTVREVLGSPAQPLAPAARSLMETHFGYDFGQVRIHADAAAARSARQVGARAYTVGDDVVFGAGQLDLGSAAGLRLVAHELAHVIQQEAVGGPATARPLTISDPGDAAEREADRAAEMVHRPSSAPMPYVGQTGHSRALIQRFESFEHVQLGDTGGLPSGGYIVLEAHSRDLPGHASPTVGWPPEWVSLWAKGTPDQQRAIRDGLTYGEVLALAGDLYASVASTGTTDIGESVERLNHASLREIWDLIPLVHGRATTTAQLQDTTGGRYLELAEQNLSHFSNVPVGQRNIDVWREGHAQAIRLARAGQANAAWLANAAADHFLTDAFSGGHLREARAPLMTSLPGQAEAKIVHDLDNKYGVDVTNRRGDHWTAYGDTYLNTQTDARNLSIALEAEALSKADIISALAQRSAYPDPPSPVPEGSFAAEALVPHPVDVNGAKWGAWERGAVTAHLAVTEGAELVASDDTRIRDWIARQPPEALRDVPTDEKLRMVNRLLKHWTSDSEVDAVERLYRNSSADDMKAIERAVTPGLNSLADIGQRTRLRVLFAERR